MKQLMLLLLVIIVFGSCRPRPTVATAVPVREVVTKVVTNTVTERDTLYLVALPADTQVNRTTDTTSVLRNSFSVSTADVSYGVLTHTLSNLDSARVIGKVRLVENETLEVDSVPYKVEVPVYIEVNKLTFWQDLQIRGFKVLGIVVLVLVGPKLFTILAKVLLK